MRCAGVLGEEPYVAQSLMTAAYAAMILLFVFVATRAIWKRDRAALDAALFFAAIAISSAIGLLASRSPSGGGDWVAVLRPVIGALLPLLLLRLLDGFTRVPALVRQAAVGGAVMSIASLLLAPRDMPGRLIPTTIFFLALFTYCAVGFVRYGASTSGVTRRRMQSIGLGTLGLLAAAMFSVLAGLVPESEMPGRPLAAVTGMAAGVGYVLGIAPPAFIRRIWQYAALTEVLRLTARTPATLPLTESIPVLSRGVAEALGAPNAAIALWDEDEQVLLPPGHSLDEVPGYDKRSALITRVFRTQRAQFFEDAPRLDPANADLYERSGASALLIAPVSAAERRFGVVTLYSPRASVFSPDDLPLLRTVGDQIAAFLVRCDLVQQAVRVGAQAEATQLKEEFLAGAAHDLRTPLTVILGRAQLMARRLERDPSAAPRVDELRALVTDGRRMQRLTEGLLEVSRLEHGTFLGDRAPTDLRDLALDVVQMHEGRAIRVEGTATADIDAERVRQVVQNLIDNAVKFTPGDGEIVVSLRATPTQARLTVEDSGLGLTRDDIDSIFERFQRGSAATRGGGGGVGVGLYLCRRIVEEHGGTIRAEQRAEGGSRFIVELPTSSAPPQDAEDPPSTTVDEAPVTTCPAASPGAAPGMLAGG